jgi:hypothetical protein
VSSKPLNGAAGLSVGLSVAFSGVGIICDRISLELPGQWNDYSCIKTWKS